MISCEKIKEFLDSNFNFKDTLSALSNNPRINSDELAYDYDKIKYATFKDNCTSADALFIKRNINLIEFKTGFDGPEDTVEEQTKKENLRLKIQLKAYHSLHLLQARIINGICSGDTLASSIKTIYCAVIDTAIPEVASDVYADVLAEEAAIEDETSFKKKIYDTVMQMYRKETDEHKKLFYDDTFVFYDYEFDKKSSALK